MVSVYGAMTHERKARIWQLWRQGYPMSVLSRDINKPPATVYSYLLYHGGINPRQSVRREGSLSMEEREAIFRGLACAQSIRGIAKQLGRAPSTISREISRNGGSEKYRACDAEKASVKRGKRPKVLLFAENAELRCLVTKLLENDWSPEQISGWLKAQSPDGKTMCVSHETIYKSLFIQTRGVLREELTQKSRSKTTTFIISPMRGMQSMSSYLPFSE